MSITLGTRTFTERPAAHVLPNEDGWFRYQVLHDIHSPLWSNAIRTVAPDPEVNRFGFFGDRTSHIKVSLNPAMQFHWAELLSLHKFGKPLADLDAEKRDYINQKMDVVMGDAFCLTNRTPHPSPARNYVADEHLEWDEAQMAALLLGGNTIWGKPAGRNESGDHMVEIYSHLKNEPLPPPSLDDSRTLWLTTVSNAINVYPFTHLGDGIGVPYPLITDARYYFPLVGLQIYSHNEPKRPIYIRNGVPSHT